MTFSFNVPTWTGSAVNIGELWRLTKGRHTAVCSLFNHPTRRIELRCVVMFRRTSADLQS